MENACSKVPLKAVIMQSSPRLHRPDKIPSDRKSKSTASQSAHLKTIVDSKLITQSWIWHRMAQWMQPHDVVFGETGTAAFGLPDATFPSDINWITQTYYGSNRVLPHQLPSARTSVSGRTWPTRRALHEAVHCSSRATGSYLHESKVCVVRDTVANSLTIDP